MKKEELIKIIYSENYLKKTISKIKSLGYKNNLNPYDFLIIRLITSIILFCLCISKNKYGYIIAPIATIIYHNIFNYILIDNKIKKRTITLEKEAMHFFEVLTLSLETGRNLSEAIEVTTNNVNGILSEEFKETVRQVSFGKSLPESLNDLLERIPSDTIGNVILSLTQSNLYGNSIIENLYNQVDYLREKRKMEVKGKIAKVPVLISVISVLFFVPLLLIIILAPILLEYL